MTLFFVVLAAIILWGIIIFNRLVQNKIHVQEAWSGIDVQLKRRHDLIPNLVETVKGYMQHERGTLENVTQLRNQAMATASVKEKSELENNISGALKTIFAVAENYPDLKANQNFLELQKELTAIEDELQLARRYYNGTVRNFNILMQSFPSNMVAGGFQFTNFEFFGLDSDTERAVPEVNLN